MLKRAAAWPFPVKGKSDEAKVLDADDKRLEQLEQIERDYNWLMDCARKTGVIVTFRGDTKSVLHGTITDAFYDLLNACKAVDADVELTGKVSAASVDMVRTAITNAGAA